MTDSREIKIIVLSTLAAGFGPLVGGTAYYLLRGELGGQNVFLTIVLSLIAYPFAIFFTCIFGLPIFFLARRFRLVNWWSAIASGVLVGCGVQVLVLSGTAHIDNLLMYSAEGAASALLFLSVWRLGAHSVGRKQSSPTSRTCP